jgi:acetylornithine deacetylase/succinyl-diaminopimelate desuccinylase-like protein
VVINNVHKHIESMQEQDLNTWKKLVAQPSVSAQNIGVRECSQMVKALMEDCGLTTQVFETPGQPILYGELITNPAAPTVLFYGHYDVQPPEPLEAWKSPPFEPTIRDGRLYGRGAADNKGQLLAHLLAVRSYLAVNGSLPINVKFVIEGEEESGSIHIPQFIEAQRDLLAADLVYTSDGPLQSDGTPVVFFGVRGMLAIELEIETSSQDNHSGNKGGVIKNAAWELVKLLATMIDVQGNVTIDGFYDDVLEPSQFELQLLEKLPYDPEALAKVFGVEKIDLEKKEFYLRNCLQPTLTINGLVSGYTGSGVKTIIPGRAVAKLDMRLVNDQDPMDIFAKIQAHVAKHNPQVKVTHMGNMPPSRTPADIPVGKVVVDAVRKASGKEPVVLPSLGASLPDYLWTKLLGLPSVGVPYANADESNHAPNENMKLECFYNGIHTTAQVIYELGNMQR